MFFLWRKAAVPAFIVTVMATASRMDPESCRQRARQAIVLVHMAADVCQWDITLPRLPGMDRPPDRRPEVLHLRRQGDTRLPPDPKRVHLRHLQPSEWKLRTCHNYFVSCYQERARAGGDDVTVLTLDASVQVFSDGEKASRVVWINDVLPNEYAELIDGNIQGA
jgi:hypothetical protein